MRKTLKVIGIGIAIAQLITLGAQAQLTYRLDNGTISTALNASDGTETRDNWFANEFTAQAGGNVITSVNLGVFTSAPSSIGDIVLYLVTDPAGNPAAGATRVYTQAFTPLTGDGTNAFMQTINLTTPVSFNVGDKFLVAAFIPNVVGNPPNDKYPFLLDTSGSAAGTFWDRSTPNTFNLDDITGAKPIDQVLTAGGWTPGPGHIFLRATAVPEPSLWALGGMAALALAVRRRRTR